MVMDQNGNLTSFNGESYTWNVRDLLIATRQPGYTATYQYATNGFRHQQTVNDVTTDFLLNGRHCLKETTGAPPSTCCMARMAACSPAARASSRRMTRGPAR